MTDALVRLDEAFQAGLDELLRDVPDLKDLLNGLEQSRLDEYGRGAARQALAPLVWRAVAGKALTTEQVRSTLGVSRQALHKRVNAGTLLAVPGDGTSLYPAWQFEGSSVRPVVAAVVAVFREGLKTEYDPRVVASWARAEQPELKGTTPAQWLSEGLDEDALVAAAERAVQALAR